ncbi:hypothetical protein DRJ87_15665, partial [Enterococcus faecalis]
EVGSGSTKRTRGVGITFFTLGELGTDGFSRTWEDPSPAALAAIFLAAVAFCALLKAFMDSLFFIASANKTEVKLKIEQVGNTAKSKYKQIARKIQDT